MPDPQGHCLLQEGLISFADATKVVPKIDGKRISTSTIWRWSQKGIRGIKLETRRVGCRLVTSAAALDRFFAALAVPNSPASPERTPPGPRSRTPQQRRRDLADADARLKAVGL